jgi:acetyl esterase/lipase
MKSNSILIWNSVSLKMNKMLAMYLIVSLSVDGYAQPDNLSRYRDCIFTKITVQKNTSYAGIIPEGAKKKRYRFDLYYATEDSSLSRPFIIWMHGGGFKFGSKKAKGIRMWSRDFGKRGYVCAAINYRRSKKNPLKNFDALVKGCYDAVQDLAQAIEFFKTNAARYRIDTSNIILAGNSAGAIIALQTAYSSNAELSALTNKNDSTLPLPRRPAAVAAVINFWGALLDTSWLHNANVPIVSVHGRKDRIVPYKHNGNSLYGSYIIHQKADSLKIPNRLKTYERFGHELQKHFIPILRSGATKQRWMEAANFAADFLYNEVFLRVSP